MPRTDNSERIAIVGVGGLFPGAPDLETFWQNIAAGIDAGRHVPPGRWYLSPEKAYAPWPPRPDRVYSTWGCFIEGFSLDPEGLQIEPRILSRLDPMFHLGLHAARAAYRDARQLRGVDHARVGVILGNIALPTESTSAICRDILGRTFVDKLIDTAAAAARQQKIAPSAWTSALADPQAAAALSSMVPRSDWHPLNRFAAGLPSSLIAQGLGLGGIAFTLDAACASSLYSLKFAAEELLSGRADAMLAGGMSRPDCQYTQMGFAQLQALSKRGRCAPLSSAADGLVVGEGAGVFVLKRLGDAVAAGDRIHGVIAGIGLSNDRGANLLAPHSEGQLRAMRSAYQQAGWKPADVDLIECHATGTPVGDAVEIDSLHQLWEKESARPRQCVIGGVKSNVGHLLTGAGAAGLMKVLLALRHQTLPPTANFVAPAERLAADDSPFRVLARSEPWQHRGPGDGTGTPPCPRRATVNAFGFGGINAHVLIEEWTGVAPTAAGLPAGSGDTRRIPVAIVGLDVHAGSFDSRQSFQHGHFQGRSPDRVPMNWWGLERSHWFQRETACGGSAGQPDFSPPVGRAITETRLPMGTFRIPPLEMQDMLPQQQLMLQVAAAALHDAGLPHAQPSHAEPSHVAGASDADVLANRTGVVVGIELDPNTTNFHFRWSVEQDAPQWSRLLGLELTDEELDEWTGLLKEAAGPPLSANRVMGNLGGIVASRLAREFDVGGPCFTVSCGGNSDVIALELAVRALQRGELDRVLVGGVLLGTDPRWHAFAESDGPSIGNDGEQSELRRSSPVRCELGQPDLVEAIVLKRHSDAAADGDRCYAVVNEFFGESESLASPTGAIDRPFPSTGETILAGNLAVRALDVYHGISRDGDLNEGADIPAVAGRTFQELRIRNGTPLWLQFTAAEASTPFMQAERRQPPGGLPLALFAVDGNSTEELWQKLEALSRLVDDSKPVDQLAARWFHRNGLNPRHRLALTVVASNAADLRAAIARGREQLESRQIPADTLTRQVFSTATPLAAEGHVAFVFPGSGNAFRQMGRKLLTVFPEVLRRQQQENQDLPGQYGFETIWSDRFDPAGVDHKTLIFSQVAIGTAICDLLAQLNVRPAASIGYSLGESAALFGLRAWTGRDEMLRRMREASLFGSDLVKPFNAARAAWQVPAGTEVPWLSGIIDRSPDDVRRAIQRLRGSVPDRSESPLRAYLLIVNTPRQCVIGGDRAQVDWLVRELNANFVPLASPSTVHCEVLRQVEDPYRELHRMRTTVPLVDPSDGSRPIAFYSAASGNCYPLSCESAADAIVAQAVDTIDFPRVIERAYADGARIFVEIGPGSSCTKMIDEILGDRPHLARAALPVTQRPVEAFVELLAALIAERVPVDLSCLYGSGQAEADVSPAREVVTRVGGVPFEIPDPPGGWRFLSVPPGPKAVDSPCLTSVAAAGQVPPVPFSTAPMTSGRDLSPAVSGVALAARPESDTSNLWDQFQLMTDQRTQAHETFLRLSARFEHLAAEQLAILARMKELTETIPAAAAGVAPPAASTSAPPAAPTPITIPDEPPTALNRDQCMEFAIGKIGRVLGLKFAAIDTHPTRVRLPDEPLMLVDRILAIEGEPLSMTSGRVVTEHDIHAGAWYLDCDRIPTCIAVESGQADLFLSGWLGIDLETKGLACYRLLDAVVTFHDALPGPGKTIHYDIRVLNFFRQGRTYLFRFEFDATVDGRPLLTMREGCAGFFTAAELAGGKGIIHTALDKRPRPGIRPADWSDPVPMTVDSYDDRQLHALRRGDLAACFGPAFADLPVRNPVTLPGLTRSMDGQLIRTRMWLVDRILRLDPAGGKFGMGTILGELDIHADDWFLTCHFCDDQVMPGTLMYECCLHTLRIYLLRMGWIGETGEIAFEPIPEVRSRLKCRGQVLSGTRKVWYEVTLKEIGYGRQESQGALPSAYCLADALMYADGRPIVEITDMSVRLTGLTKENVERLWRSGQRLTPRGDPSPAPAVVVPDYDRRPAIFDTDRITAFAIGRPSDAFGDRYRPFDEARKIARLPGPPFQFLDRIVSIQGCQPWILQAGGTIVAQYDVPPDAWYFQSNRQAAMPFAVLLETALQPCGWLAAYVGSALTSDTDLSFRNLGGTATQFRNVTPQSGTLTTTVTMTRVSNSAGMIIQHYDFDLRCGGQPVYTGNTYFGFFSKGALSNQVGIREANPYRPSAEELSEAWTGPYPADAPFPDDQFRMIRTVECLVRKGGPYGHGCIIGKMPVDPAAWFFKAHFYQDPVVPGSLGLESFWQLLKLFAADRWSAGSRSQFETPAIAPANPGQAPAVHEWVYRGQVVPADQLVTVTAVIRDIDDSRRRLTAEGFLSVDGRVIYQMKNFTLDHEVETPVSNRS